MEEKELLGNYCLVLGLEIHLHLKTSKKMFCGCSADIWGKEPNTVTCPVCLGLPGALPVPNFEAVRKTQLLGLALNCSINGDSRFDRKHYFYPDLPKGYQISQYKQPLCVDGKLVLDSGNTADIERVHLEEDVAKSFHEGEKTLVDFNKSGIPLVDAVDYCKQIQTIVRYLGIGEADMEKGQMRLEVNISLRTKKMEEKNELADYKVEVKNINSFKFVEKAVKAEIIRQREILESGGVPAQENRGFKETEKGTVSQRSKEEAKDYRYFPEPDIPPMEFDEKYISELKENIPELPGDTKKELVSEYKISGNSAKVLVDNLGTEYIYKFKALVAAGVEPSAAANVLINKTELRNLTVEEIASDIKKCPPQLPREELEQVITKVLSENIKAVEDYKNGKEASMQFLVGAAMKQLKGKADASVIKDFLVSKINS
jgi:aspartyl-tRNA(Asn)/glutamyl-tRNA(Gln) amidotransferase subunit B